jgi:hypothetical protein
MAEIRTLQAERKASLEQPCEEADLLCQLGESNFGPLVSEIAVETKGVARFRISPY